MAEFRVDNCVYAFRPMDAFTQLDVIAKLSPLLASGFAELIPFFIKMRDEGLLKIEDIPLKEAVELAPPVAREISKMDSKDRRFIIEACLSLCERKMDGSPGFAPIWNAQVGRAQFEDINSDISIMLRITQGVLMGTFKRFFPESLFALFEGAAVQSSKSST